MMIIYFSVNSEGSKLLVISY